MEWGHYFLDIQYITLIFFHKNNKTAPASSLEPWSAVLSVSAKALERESTYLGLPSLILFRFFLHHVKKVLSIHTVWPRISYPLYIVSYYK